MEQRARQLFEEWKDKELEKLSKQKADMLFEDWKRKYEKKIRKDAIEKSKSVIIGKVTEHFAPFLPEFKYNPKDARFIGSPVDFIVFDGLDEGDLKKIVFLDVKTGKSPLSKREKLIKKIVESKKS
ncbi:Holliday junction resolvase-like protein [Methanotorris igneus]|uniref:Holliday junction resolvase-like protein n=1 Tax=Methanotorris igneus (strain DSM 5666 / JCM 11834 / Kol 5) TaxID=880724 RepID=F6BCI4_METIK|nr:Holliday junction resolvase-like protein [Methanotorris igneus]AEF96195.1 Holliday junction resolvase-like protein [Methanotorris igneus Kol 5]